MFDSENTYQTGDVILISGDDFICLNEIHYLIEVGIHRSLRILFHLHKHLQAIRDVVSKNQIYLDAYATNCL